MQPYYADDAVTLYHGDCREVLPLAADVVFTDPPYGTGDYRVVSRLPNGNAAAKTHSKEAWDVENWDWLGGIATRGVMLFWPVSGLPGMACAMAGSGRKISKALYMRKRTMRPAPGGWVTFTVDPLWVWSEGPFSLRGGVDICDVVSAHSQRTGHPHEKPVDFCRWALSKVDAASVLDPFAGSGSLLRAAKDLGRKAIGIEIEERYCEIAARRLSQEVLDFGQSHTQGVSG